MPPAITLDKDESGSKDGEEPFIGSPGTLPQKRNSKEQFRRRASTIESATGEQLILAPEEETYEMRGLLINVFISVLLGILIGLCGALFHNAVHMVKVFFRVVLGGLFVDAFEWDGYIFIHMWLGATATSLVVSFITRHMCPECIGG
eukprot:GSA25T00012346001.1